MTPPQAFSLRWSHILSENLVGKKIFHIFAYEITPLY